MLCGGQLLGVLQALGGLFGISNSVLGVSVRSYTLVVHAD